MPRTIVIGDIHGALKALQQIIGKINPQQDDQLIFLGDYVDGWSQSAQVIQYLLQLATQVSCRFIRGNHDDWCASWLNHGTENEEWLLHGGEATVASYAACSTQEKNEHQAFFKEMQAYYIDEHNRLFIHAGFTSMHGPAKEPCPNNFTRDRTLWEMARILNPQLRSDSSLYPKRLLLFREIYIGHTPTTHYATDTPMQAGNLWNIDTGAAFTGKLTAMDIETKQFWQSDQVTTLYPTEKGRNPSVQRL